MCCAPTSCTIGSGRGLAFEAISRLVEDEVPDALAAVAQVTQGTGIDKVSEQNRVSRRHLGADRVGGMPSVLADRERVTGVGRELHLGMLGHAAVGAHLMENRADVSGR